MSEAVHERLAALGARVQLELVPRAVHQLSAPVLDAALRAWLAPPTGGASGLRPGI